MKIKNKRKLIIALSAVLLVTGCTQTLKTEDKKVVKNPETGQSLTANILCKPTNEKTIEVYEENGVDLAALPKCTEFKITSGGYEGLWTSVFVKPLAFIILFIAKYVKSAGFALILTSLALRFILYPVTRKTALQSELIKKAQPELDRLEKKYANKTDQDSLMKKSQEMTMIYKKYNINPISGCLYSFIQLPLFIAFLEAINRVPSLFEENFLTLQLGTTPSIGLFTHGNILYVILIVLVGLTTHYSFSLNKTTTETQNDPMKNMTNVMTGMIVVMGFFMPTALCLYWITTNLFTIGQNLIVKRSKEAQ
ncbi:MAG: YidC/Oxa1 family membrane protein insertase [Firmicutes bacterium]|nr:YidC/Oxa1 family membrane protein insertase [Bacillota bacterium]